MVTFSASATNIQPSLASPIVVIDGTLSVDGVQLEVVPQLASIDSGEAVERGERRAHDAEAPVLELRTACDRLPFRGFWAVSTGIYTWRFLGQCFYRRPAGRP